MSLTGTIEPNSIHFSNSDVIRPLRRAILSRRVAKYYEAANQLDCKTFIAGDGARRAVAVVCMGRDGRQTIVTLTVSKEKKVCMRIIKR